jgi:nucleoid DNA-binding protein
MTIVGVFVLFALSSIFVGTPPPTFFSKTMTMIKINVRHPVVVRAAKRAGLSKAKTARLAEYIFEALKDELVEEKEVIIVGLGRFSIRYVPGLQKKRWDVNLKKVVRATGYWRAFFYADAGWRKWMRANKHKL